MQTELGTMWVDPGKGERLDVLLAALGEPSKRGDDKRGTNLRLTGAPIQEYDRQRLRATSVTAIGD